MFCMKCGSQLADDAKFCTTCGTATDNVGAMPSGMATADATGSVPTVPPSTMVPPGGQGVSPMVAEGAMPATGVAQAVPPMAADGGCHQPVMANKLETCRWQHCLQIKIMPMHMVQVSLVQ